MKRLRVDESSKEGSGPSIAGPIYRQTLPNVVSSAAFSGSAVKVLNEGMQSGLYSQAQGSYGTMPVAAAPLSGGKPQSMPLSSTSHNAMRTTGASPPSASLQEPQQQPSPSNFQRLKVEDALSYLDLVKYKFGSKPQVYNDFLDIMKEFKSQSIDTPGVIERVSSLFKGFPELIVGFNTFLPPGYKIEVQRSDQGGYAFSVSVSVPNPTGAISSDQQKSAMILSGSGRINMSGPPTQAISQPPPPPPPQTLTLAQPPLQAPQPPPQPQQPQPIIAPAPQPNLAPQPVGHHSSSGYAMSAPTNYGLSLSAAQAAVNHALQGHPDTPQNQPVEFNHAINYVNKIKNRFQGQPEKYKRFLEILHTYQKEQRTMKESNVGSNVKHLTEQEVYSQVAKLFENQSDLLAEFGQFLPDATSHINQAPVSEHSNSINKKSMKPYHRDHLPDRHISHKSSHQSGSVKRSPPYSGYHHRDAPPPKKPKISPAYRDVSLSEAGKYGTLNDYAFFDKVRKALRSQEVYSNFLRCLVLFNQEIISKSELLQIVTPFLGKFPELLKWFREFMGQNETEPIPYNAARSERPQGEHVLEIDLTTAKRLGASYCIIPKAQEGQKCSGRTQLCKEVLNDQWVSFPTWSEDSTFVSSRKTQYEEYMYRCEDERFELDVVIETNASTIRVLEAVNKKLSRMGPDEVAKFKLDDCLGGTSPTLHQRALRRIYGEKAQDMIEGLKKSPSVAVPVVLKRLKLKEDEWREAQKGFNKIWREQNEKYYLKSLDHMGINFKQTDVKAIRTKSLFNEIETIFDERHEQNDEGAEPVSGPHLVIPYRDKGILDDAANLLIHHVKRQTGIQKGEKRKIKQLLRQFVPDLFFHTRQPLSDDEREEDDDNDEKRSPSSSPKNGDSKDAKMKEESAASSSADVEDSPPEVKSEPDIKDEDAKVPLHAQTSNPEEAYTLFMANNNWYIFFRLHAILCERLLRIYERAVKIAQEERRNGENRKSSTAIALRLKPKPQIEIEDYYPAFLDMVKNLLDGNMEANTYEDTLREMFGIHAYIAFTLDKVVSYAVRQLQHCVTERTAIGCTELYLKENKRGAAGGLCSTAYKRVHMEQAYQRAAEKVVQEENCFKIYIYKCDCKISIELLDTEPEDSKKAEEANKWNSYKECFANIANASTTKPRSPVYLSRNLKLYKRQTNNKKSRTSSPIEAEESDSKNKEQKDSNSSTSRVEPESSSLNMFDALERKLNERAPERNETSHPGYQVNDDQECKFNMHDSKITFTLTKDSFLYKNSAFLKARQSHPRVTKSKATKFRAWLKRWASTHVTDAHAKQCTDWLMGRGEGVVPNRTRVITDNDLQRTPYVPYNRYRVDRLPNDSATST